MKVTVEDSCIACGACESICEKVFTIADKAEVNEAEVEANVDGVKEAVEACPVGAIVIE